MNIAPLTTSVSLIVRIIDDSRVPVTGLVAATFPTTYYLRAGQIPVSITLVDLSIAADNYSSGGVFELGGGYYRIDVPDAAFSTVTHSIVIYGEASGKHLSAEHITCQYMRSDVRRWNGTAPANLVSTAVPASLSATERETLAAVIIRRTMANVEADAAGDTLDEASLYGLVQRVSKSSTLAHTNKLTIYQTDGTTELAQVSTASDASADPITKVGV